MQKHCFNILTFNHPQEELTLYFTNEEDENLTRIFHKLVPDEVIKEFGEQEHYYTSFTKEMEGFYPVTKAVNPSYEVKEDDNGEERSIRVHNSALSVSILKRYYNALIHQYFKGKRCSAFGRQQIKSPNHYSTFFGILQFLKVKKRAVMPYGCFAKATQFVTFIAFLCQLSR